MAGPNHRSTFIVALTIFVIDKNHVSSFSFQPFTPGREDWYEDTKRSPFGPDKFLCPVRGRVPAPELCDTLNKETKDLTPEIWEEAKKNLIQEVRGTFVERMGMTDKDAAAVIAGGHTFGFVKYFQIIVHTTIHKNMVSHTFSCHDYHDYCNVRASLFHRSTHHSALISPNFAL